MGTFEDINGRIVYAKAKSKTEALSMKDEAIETSQTGKSVVIFFSKRYHLFLAPGHDPYQIRREIEDFVNPPKVQPKENPEAEPEKESKPKSPVRDASGKFVAKRQSSKKNFWDALK